MSLRSIFPVFARHSRSDSRRPPPLNNAQPSRATVTGIVRDAITEGPIPGVVVSIPNTSYQSLSDSSGRYTLRNVPFGNQTIDARRIGYSQAHDENVIVNRAEFTHNVILNSVALSLAAVTTSATVDPTSGISHRSPSRRSRPRTCRCRRPVWRAT